MGQIGRGFDLEVMRKSKLKKTNFIFCAVIVCEYFCAVIVTIFSTLLLFPFLLLLLLLFSYAWLLMVTHGFLTHDAHGSKNLFSHIEFTVQILSKSITSNNVTFSFLSYFG